MFGELHRVTKKVLVKFLIVFAGAFFVCTQLSIALGATDDFLVRTLIGDDTTPPTVPANLVATPVATSQIDLTWATSSDNFILSGYTVWRDGAQIATTTTEFYADTGLTASTTYTYYVVAFDSFSNFSASSTEVATTTLSPPPAPETPTTTPNPDSSTNGTRIRPPIEQIISLTIVPQKDSVLIRYETKGYVRSVIKWGRTTSYELGSLAEQAFTTKHETRIQGLTPNTTYTFTIEGENRLGRYGAMHTGMFTTLPPDDTFPPENVSNLQAVRDGDDIVLTWTNPEDPDLTKVRVMQSDRFYPSDTADGWVIYEGLDDTIRDTGRARADTRQFYTVFTYDALGNISSGAVVSVYPPLPQLPPGDTPVPQPDTDVDPTKNEITLSFDDIFFTQEGRDISKEGNVVRIDGAKQLTIYIPYERLPEHLKTILVVVGDATDTRKTFKFLLRANSDKTAYTSSVAPLGRTGNFPVQLSVFDFKTAQIGYTDGVIASHIMLDELQDTRAGGGFLSYLITIGTSYILWFVILLLILTYLGRNLMRTEW